MLEAKLLSCLLDYPQPELWQNAAEVERLIQQSDRFSVSVKSTLQSFVRHLLQQDLLDAQENYSQLFDRGRALSLLLFEHVHGDSRDRGQAMVDLLSVYQQNGFELSARELPDYLPLFLEYLAQRPQQEIKEWLSDAAPVLGLLKARLEQRGSLYYAVFGALLAWVPDSAVDLESLRLTAAKEPNDNSLEAMDKIWEEEAIKFGAGGAANSCASQSAAPVRTTSNVKWVNGARLS